MLQQITIPKVGYGISEGVITEWLVPDGSYVEAETPLYLLETDKSEVEQPAPTSGWLRILLTDGSSVEGGSVIGLLADSEDALHEVDSPAVEEPAAGLHDATSDPAPEEDPQPESPARSHATPRARRLAAEHGLDVEDISGTGPGGQVSTDDVERHMRELPDIGANAVSEPHITPVPLTGWRRALSNRLMRSMQETAHLTTIREIDVTALIAHRENMKKDGMAPPSVTAFLIKAVALTLREFPELNGTVQEYVVLLDHRINISVAVETERGVTTPVLDAADGQRLSAIQEFLATRAVAAREARLTPEETSGGTFTVTTTGPDGADWGTPILNWPQIAILLTGRVLQHLALVDGSVVLRHVMGISLTYDHRAVDGVPTARFIASVERLCADPAAWGD